MPGPRPLLGPLGNGFFAAPDKFFTVFANIYPEHNGEQHDYPFN